MSLLRHFKIALVVFIAMQALFYAIQNLANLEQAFGAVAYVMSNAEHQVYANSAFPAITSPVLIWIALGVILAGEFAAGLLAAKGAFDMWTKRKASADEFYQGQKFAFYGCLMSMIVWFGFFMVIAGAFFQMWQTTPGAASFNGSFQYFSASALVLISLCVVKE